MNEPDSNTDKIIMALGSFTIDPCINDFFGKIKPITNSELMNQLAFLKTNRIAEFWHDEIRKAQCNKVKQLEKFQEVYVVGGLVNYNKLIEENKQKVISKENDQSELMKLQKEALEYQQTIRTKDEEIKEMAKINLAYSINEHQYKDSIRSLENQLLWINVLQKYWWVILTSIAIGGFITKLFQ